MIEIVNEDARVALKRIAGEVLSGKRAPYQMALTSPPYFRMRDYGIPPVIWGGDGSCDHEWGEEIPNDKGSGGRTEWQVKNRGSFFDVSCGRLCAKCGAWLGQLGMEPDPRQFVSHLVGIFMLLWDVLDDTGTFWLNIADTYAGSMRGWSAGKGNQWGKLQSSNPGSLFLPPVGAKEFGLKPGDLIGIPWMVAMSMRDAGWYLRSDIIDHVLNPMPESIKSRPSRAHEYIFLFSKRMGYHYNYYDARIKTSSGYANMKNVWSMLSGATQANHTAAFPTELVTRAVRAGSSVMGRCPSCNRPWIKNSSLKWVPGCRCGEDPVQCWIIDPFAGSGTTAVVGRDLNQSVTLIDQSTEYCEEIGYRLGHEKEEEEWELPVL